MKISGSFLACELITPVVEKFSVTDIDYIHMDFIDGKFVKGRTIPFRRLKQIYKFTKKRLDVHLMTDKLDKYIKKFATLDAEYITFHVEVEKNIEKYIDMIHSFGIKAGLAINPDTEIEELYPYLDRIDMVLFMGVEPGLGGQEYNSKVTNKIKKLREYVTINKLDVLISVDGGINLQTSKKVKPYVDMLVSGSYITSSDNFQKQIDSLR